jgi:hypothetical protein
MKREKETLEKPNRRQFLRRGMLGAWLFGAGGVAGYVSRARADKAPPLRLGSGNRALGKEFTYDVSALRKTDPALVLFEQTASIPTGFKELRGVCVGLGDAVYAVGDKGLRVFDASGAAVKQLALSEMPRCVAVAEDQTVFVGVKDHVEVLVPGASSFKGWETLGPKSVLTSIAVSGEHVFIADAGNRIVVHYDRGGKIVNRIGKKDPDKNVPGFIVPSPYFDLGMGPDGMLWAANPGRHQIEAYDFSGRFELSWGEAGNGIEGFCGCCNPVHFARLPDGQFITSEKGLVRIKIYSETGKFIGFVAGAELFPEPASSGDNANPPGLDVAADSKGRVLVADSYTGEIRIFTRKKKS